MATWADIKRLAADLERVQQLTDFKKKLSDVNCIELVSMLINKKLIEVVFTRDGHAYVTKSHLVTEVRNECLGNGGRAALTDIASALNVDFDHIDNAVHSIIEQEDSGYIVSNGELFALEYVDKLRAELKEMLRFKGTCTLNFIGKNWDLSRELLQNLLLSRLEFDPDLVLEDDAVFTKEYIIQRKNIVRAVLSAVTCPTLVSKLIDLAGVNSKGFWLSFDELTTGQLISGRIQGSRTSNQCLYVPKVYDRSVSTFLNDSYGQNKFLPFDVLRKCGIAETSKAISNVLGDNSFVMLPSMAIHSILLENCICIVSEAVKTDGICDAQAALQSMPVAFDTSDIEFICERICSGEKGLITSGAYVFSVDLLKNTLNRLRDRIESTAAQELEKFDAERKNAQKKGAAAKKANDEEDDWTDNKKGGGKKKGGKGGGGGGKSKTKVEESVKSGPSSVDDDTLHSWIAELGNVPDEIVEVVAEHISEQVNTKLHEKFNELVSTQQATTAQSQKRNIAAVQARAQSVYNSICIFAASSSSFPAPLSDDLRSHIIKTLGNDLAGAVLTYASGTENAELMNEKTRNETLKDLTDGQRESITALYDAVKSVDIESLHNAIDDVGGRNGCGLLLKRPKDSAVAEFAAKYEKELEEAVQQSAEPAATLLSVVLLLFVRHHRPIIATGKFVQRLIAELQGLEHTNITELLTACQIGVVNCIKNKNDDVAKEMLNQDISKLIALVTKQ